MNIIKNIFWNREEGRLRAGYRILLMMTVYRIVWKGLGFIFENIPGLPEHINSETPYWYFLIPAGIRLLRVVSSVWIAAKFFDRRMFTNFGLHLNKNWWKDIGFGLGLGILLMGSIFLIELSAGWIYISETFHTAQSGQPFMLSAIVFLIFFICVGISEEILSRGYILKNISEGFNYKLIGPENSIIIAVILSSVFFGFLHMGNANASIVSTINIILWGVLFAIPFILTGNLAIPIGIHTSWNFFQGNVFGFPVSGAIYPSQTVSFFSINQSGPEFWTGGVFGPEAGMLNLIFLIVGFLLILGWIKFRYGNIEIHNPLAEPSIVKKLI